MLPSTTGWALTAIVTPVVLASAGFVSLQSNGCSGTSTTENEPVPEQPSVIEPARTPADSSLIDFDMGTFITPQNFPDGLFDEQLMTDYYENTARVGQYVGIFNNWFDADNAALDGLWEQQIQTARARGLRFVVLQNFLNEAGSDVATPPSVSGNSFTDPSVRQAYTDELLRVARLGPDVLAIGTEVNNLLFHDNRREFAAFLEFSRELYTTLKQSHPTITIAITFQWDLMRLGTDTDFLIDFRDSLDIYGFSTYPNVFGVGAVDGIPGQERYFSDVRNFLLSEARVAITETGWSSREFSSESEQATYYRRLPALFRDLAPEFVISTYLHDFDAPSSSDQNTRRFSSMGLQRVDGTEKPAWNEVLNYYDR